MYLKIICLFIKYSLLALRKDVLLPLQQRDLPVNINTGKQTKRMTQLAFLRRFLAQKKF